MKIAIIGCGKQSFKHISGIRSAAKETEIVVYDENLPSAEKLARTTNVQVADWQDILGDETVSGGIICTPTHTHTNISLDLMHSGKSVLCEKPLSHSKSSHIEIIEAEKRTGCKLVVGYIYRQSPRCGALKTFTTQGMLGDIFAAHFRVGGRGDHSAWKHRSVTGGGAINEMLVHMIDLAQWTLGPLDKISEAFSRNLRPERLIGGERIEQDVEDYIAIRATMKSGAEVWMEADLTTTGFTQHVELLGCNGNGFTSIVPHMPSFVFLKEAKGGMQEGFNELEPVAEDFYSRQAREFFRMLKGGAHNLHTAEDSLELHKHISEISKLAKATSNAKSDSISA